MLKGVVVTDHKQLLKGLDAADGFGQPLPPGAIHIGGRLVKEGDIDIGQHLEQGEAHRQGGAHLLTPREVHKSPLVWPLLHHNFVVASPF